MESVELVQYDDNEEHSGTEGLDMNTDEMEGTTDVGYSIDFEKQELLDGEEVVMEGLSLPDGAEGLQVIQCEDEDVSDVLGENPRYRKVDKDDPRSRLHYIKYLKKEGKPMKMWECGICGKEFRHQYTLMRHLPTHTDERNYKCEDCGKAFRQMSTLSQHRAIHSDARPYVCEYCKKTFNRVSTLISHRKTHSDMKPHKCPVCFKGFHQKGNLRNHVFTHTNERPYKCEVCEKGFNQMSNLVCHKAHVHGDKSRHVCQMCGSEFLRRYALRLHQEYTHGIVCRGGNLVQLSEEETQEIRRQDSVTQKRNVRAHNVGQGNPGKGKQTAKASVEAKVTPSSEVIIDPIETKAMKTAKDAGQTTFALFKPAKGIPVLVKVEPAPNNKQMLVPATVEDLKSAGKITVSPNYESGNSGSPIKAVQIKVPVVATVIQRVGENGQLTISVESPGPDQTTDASQLGEETVLEESETKAEADDKEEAEPDTYTDTDADADADVDAGVLDEAVMESEGNVIHYIDEDGTVVAINSGDHDHVQYLQDDCTLDPTVIMHPDATIIKSEMEHDTGEYVVEDGAPEIMQIDTGGEIQLVRSAGDGTYEVLSQEEAALLLQHQNQGIAILDAENPDVQFQEMLGEGDDGGILVNQNNLSALVSAIRSAGYEVMPGEGEEGLEQMRESEVSKNEIDIVQVQMEDGASYI